MNSLSYYVGLVNECLRNDKAKMDLYREIDRHRLGKWKPSTALRELPWIRGHNFSSTAPADALDAGTRTFASLMPRIEIAPLSEEIEEYERVEKLETAMEWHFKRMNMGMHDKKTTHWKIMESAMRYCAVAFETEYLPFSMKDRTGEKRIKALLRGSSFRWTVHHPGTVHPLYSRNGLECVSVVKLVTFQEMYDEFGKGNPGIQQIVRKQFDGEKPDYQKSMSTYFAYCKTIDWDETCIALYPNGGLTIPQQLSSDAGIELLHKEHELDFIPFVFADNEDPILKNAINTGLLDNLNNLRLISYSSAVALAAASQQLIQTLDGTMRNVKVDNKNPTQPMVTDLTTKVTPLPQQQTNRGVDEKVTQATQEVYTSTVAQILADANKLAGTENFSTANLAFQIALSNLALAKDAGERAEAEGVYQNFQWIKHAKDKPLVAFRDNSKNVDGKTLQAGEELTIRPDDFDTRYLYITVKLREFSSLDEQAMWNLAITQVERMGMSRQMIAEENGVEDYHLHEKKRAVEDLFLAKVQERVAKIQAEAEAYRTKVVGEAEAQVQQAIAAAKAAQGGGGNAPTNPANPADQVTQMNSSNPVAEGADMRAGMMSAQQANPMESAPMLTGQTATGGQVA